MNEKPSFEQLTNVRSVRSGAWSPDGTRFAYLADTSGRLQLWMQPAGGGFAIQLTSLAEMRVTDFRWSRAGERIAFGADRNGNEQYQVFVIDVLEDAASGPRLFPDSPQSQYIIGDWTPDGKIVVSGNDRDPTQVDVILLDPDSGETERLLTGGTYYADRVSPDGRWLTVLAYHSNSNSDVHVMDFATGASELLTAHTGDARFAPGPWSQDSEGFILLSDQEGEFTRALFLDIRSGELSVHLDEGRDVEMVSSSPGGRFTAFVQNDDGCSRLGIWDAERAAYLEPALPRADISAVSLHPDLPRALLTMTSSVEASNLFELDFLAGNLERREQSMLGGVDVEQLIWPELIRYPSFDREIAAWLYRPAGPGPHPVLLSIHGGPEDQERPNYAYGGMYQFLLANGIAVLAPNIRGSTGYGKTFQRLIQRDWGGGELRDIEAAADWLGLQEWADSSKTGIFGASFGGFATLSAISRLPGRWAVAAEAVGPVNLLTFAQSVPPHWARMMRHFVGDPVDDRELLVERSPLRYLDAVDTPLLVYQGANDPRVVKAESDQLVAALRDRGLSVEYHIDELSGHGPADRDTAVQWWRTISEFLIGHLAPAG